MCSGESGKKNMPEESGRPEKVDYRWSGVDIDAASRAVEMIKRKASQTLRPEVLSGIGGFNALFELDLKRYENPVLVSGADGVGTKLKLAQMMGKHDTVGIDLVAMCADDVVTCGAEPLFFQDYIATGRVEPDVIADIVSGIADGCSSAGCSLVGGEIAEHPGIMGAGDYDIAGFCVGVVEKDRIIDGSKVMPGDRVVGMVSSGLHSNGYSLVRKLLFETGRYKIDERVEGLDAPLGAELIKPSLIYAPVILELARSCDLRAAAHITGGGITENLPRVIPDNTDAEIGLGTWPVGDIFTFIEKAGRIDAGEMLRTFNMGLGMMIVIPPEDLGKALDITHASLFDAFEVGKIVEGTGQVRYL